MKDLDSNNTLETKDEIESIEIDLLLDGIYRRYGYDFRSYASASIRRRIWKFAEQEGLATISAVQEAVLHQSNMMDKFVLSLTVNVTTMFRDPAFFLALRNSVVPILKTYPMIRIWDAGCATGEEAYSMAIVLKEEGIYDRCRIYATDMNEDVLRKAKTGIFPLSHMKEFTDNYIQSGGKTSFSDYYTAKYDYAIINQELRQNIIFAQHNLVTDKSFNEFNLVLIRNVLIYFNEELRAKVLDLLHDSMASFGILALGKRESLKFSKLESFYEELDSAMKLYKRCA
ncbi:MAG TPA: protein-glutamate O-methyltransferase CheR [Drouetiella sp.]|jgi:chemotaxis protein methyltransferase CheR